jgi:opacity protein-like surface antigen
MSTNTKFLTLLLIPLFFCFNTNGQKGLEFGAYVQPQTHWIFNAQDMDAGDAMQYKLPYSMGIGINLGYNFTDFLGVRTGLAYTIQGQDYVNRLSEPDTSFAIDLKYLKVPLYVKLNTGISTKISFMVMGGPQIGYLTSAEYIWDDERPVDISENYNSIELGVSGAAGLQVNMDDGSTLNFLIRGEYSLNNIEVEMAGRDATRNLAAGLYIAYNYNLYFR